MNALPERVTQWDLSQVKSEAGWVFDASTDPILDVLKSPELLPPWLEGTEFNSVLIAHSDLGSINLIRLKSATEAIATLEASEKTLLPGGKQLIPIDSEQAVVMLDPSTLLAGDTSTIETMFQEVPKETDDESQFSDFLELLRSTAESSPVSIIRRDAEVPGGWKMTLLRVSDQALTHEEVLIDQNGEPLPVFPSGEQPALDLVFDRVLFSPEIKAIKRARRFGRSTYKGSYVMVAPKEFFLGEIVEPIEDRSNVNLLDYLPERFESVKVLDFRKIRQNSRFETFQVDPSTRPHYWNDLDQKIHGFQIRDLDKLVTCTLDNGTVQILSLRYGLNAENLESMVDVRSGYSVRGKEIYPIVPRTLDNPQLCLIDERTVLIGSGGNLERIIRNPGSLVPTMTYMKDLYPHVEQFEDSLIFKVEGRTADLRYKGVRALFFGESMNDSGFNSRRIIKCGTDEATEDFIYQMRQRIADATASGFGSEVAALPSVGLNGLELVVSAQVPANLWDTYEAYFRKVILPEES